MSSGQPRVAVVGHVEWVQFARVAHVPGAGEVAHARDVFEEPAGGGAVAAVQLAAALGHRVLALSRSPEKSRRLEQLGATGSFSPEEPKWRDAVKALLAPRQVDLAIDNIGGNGPHIVRA